MKFVIKKDLISKYLKSIRSVEEEAVLTIRNDLFNITVSDTANVSMINANLYSNAFIQYDVSDYEADDNGVIKKYGIDVRKINLLINSMRDDVNIEFNDNVMVICSKNTKYRVLTLDTRNFKDVRNVPDLKFSHTIDMIAHQFMSSIKSVKQMTSYVRIECDDESIKFIGGEDVDGVEVRYNIDELINLKGDGKSSSMFAIERLMGIVSVLNKEDIISLSMGNDYPIRIQYVNSPMSENDIMDYTFLLAPRIEQ